MAETVHRSPEKDEAQRVHRQYKFILHHFVGEARDTRTHPVKLLAGAIYDTKHFQTKIRAITENAPEGLEDLKDKEILANPQLLKVSAYLGLMAARARGDFDRTPRSDKVEEVLRSTPGYEEAQSAARLSLRGDGEAPHDKVKAFKSAGYTLVELPRLPVNPFAEASTPTEMPQPSVVRSVPPIPRQPSFELVAHRA